MKILGEIGINHNGDIKIAKKLIDICAELKIEAVKFQKRDIYKVYDKEMLSGSRKSPWGETQEDQKKGLEFGQKEYEEINNYCKSKNIKWFASAWDINSLKFLDQFDCEYNKIASAMITSNKFLEEVSKRQKYTFISTGMSDMKIIENAVNIFNKNNCKFELMYCVSVYPCKPELIDLNCIKTLRENFNCDVGYSGHENGIAISLAAVGMGITLPLSCDIRLMSKSSKISFRFAAIGLTPEYGSSHLLAQIVGYGKAMEYMLSGRFIDSIEALDSGLVNHVFEDDELIDESIKIANEIAQNPEWQLSQIKKMMRDHLFVDDFDRVITTENKIFRQSQDTEAHKEFLLAFRENRKPNFHND